MSRSNQIERIEDLIPGRNNFSLDKLLSEIEVDNSVQKGFREWRCERYLTAFGTEYDREDNTLIWMVAFHNHLLPNIPKIDFPRLSGGFLSNLKDKLFNSYKGIIIAARKDDKKGEENYIFLKGKSAKILYNHMKQIYESKDKHSVGI